MAGTPLSRILIGSMAAIALAAGGGLYAVAQAPSGYPVPNDGDVALGVQLDWDADTMADYADRRGSTPAFYGRYTDFPLSAEDIGFIQEEVDHLAEVGSALMLTLEPREGLESVTPETLQELTEDLTRWNNAGVPVLVRFAHEMNGSWYIWGQKPEAYVQAFREVAEAVHKTPSSSTLWSPNEGGGYPFAGGPAEALPGTADFTALDTDGDGRLTMSDDPYAPYWPGEDAVDWVGLTVYHFGETYPWGENVVPEDGKLAAKISGSYVSETDDEREIPDFYTDFSEAYAKPFAISETGSFYNSDRSDGASALEVKQAWWEQLFSEDLHAQFPRLKLAAWFEFAKTENDSGSDIIDWRTTEDPEINDAYRQAVPGNFLGAPTDR
jgi:hypothetical protein